MTRLTRAYGRVFAVLALIAVCGATLSSLTACVVVPPGGEHEGHEDRDHHDDRHDDRRDDDHR
jgi:hypothetical protein